MNESDQKLIHSIAQHHELYDPSNTLYTNNVHRDVIWNNIANEHSNSIDYCKKRWKSLRDGYRKVWMNHQSGKSTKNMKRQGPSEMDFLAPYLQFNSNQKNSKRKKPKKVSEQPFTSVIKKEEEFDDKGECETEESKETEEIININVYGKDQMSMVQKPLVEPEKMCLAENAATNAANSMSYCQKPEENLQPMNQSGVECLLGTLPNHIPTPSHFCLYMDEELRALDPTKRQQLEHLLHTAMYNFNAQFRNTQGPYN